MFNYGRGNRPLGRDTRVKTNHPINIYRELIPHVDTPSSPPLEDRRIDFVLETPTYEPSSAKTSLESVASHFKGLALSEDTPLTGCSDCIVCGKTAAQIQSETVIVYLSKTVTIGETEEQTEAKKSVLKWNDSRNVLIGNRGVSQAAACDGNFYSISYNYQQTLPVKIPTN